jgi:proteasome assembly chaperone (PAC2) family protein
MASELQIVAQPRLHQPTLLLALSGWMDGGLVSTGTVRRLMEGRDAFEVARIDPDSFYIYNFPGPMELAALFRPKVRYVQGIAEELDQPANTFYCDPDENLLFFLGKEPNLRWQRFADCVFELCAAMDVRRVIFVGSFGGTVPHTREPRMFGSVSHVRLQEMLRGHGVRLSEDEGPSGFSTLLLAQCPTHNLDMLSLVAEIPGYLEGINPLSIDAVTRRLGKILNLPVDLDPLRRASDEWEVQVTQAVDENAELAETVRKLEEQYDNELIEPDTAD